MRILVAMIMIAALTMAATVGANNGPTEEMDAIYRMANEIGIQWSLDEIALALDDARV